MAAASGGPESLNPSRADRVRRALRPELLRTTPARRVLAGTLVILAGAAALRPDVSGMATDVVTAATDLRPGHRVEADDLRIEKRSAATLPDGAITSLDGVAGLQVAGPVRRGEILTDARVLRARLAGISVGPDARVVGVRLAEAGMLDVVRPGDVVDVLGGTADRESPRLLASAAVVVGVSSAAAAPAVGADRLLLLALPAASAATVAAAGLAGDMALTVR